MPWDFWRFWGTLLLLTAVGIGYVLIRVAQALDDLVDVFYDDADEECRATRRLPGMLPEVAGHMHSCRLDAGHALPHNCPVCWLNWNDLAQGGPIPLEGRRLIGDSDGAR